MKRFVRITLFVFAALILAGIGILFIATKSNSVHQIIIGRVNNGIPGTLSFDRLRLSLLDMRLELNNFSLSDSLDKKLAGFNRLLVDISPLALLRRNLIVEELIIENPQASLEIDSNGQLALLRAFPQGNPKPPDTASITSDSVSKPFHFELHSLEIIGGTFFFATQQDSFNIHSYGLAVTASGESGTRSGNLHITFDSTKVEKNNSDITLYDMSLLTHIREMDIDTVIVSGHTNRSNFTLNGNALSLFEQPLVNVALITDLDLSEIGSITGIEEPLYGDAKLTVHLEGSISNPNLDLQLTYSGGSIYGYPVDTLYVNTNMTDRSLQLNPLYAQTATGAVAITGNVNARSMFPDGFLEAPGSLQKLTYNLTISGKEISLKELIPAMSGTGAASIVLNGQGIHPDSLDASLTLTTNITALKLDTSRTPQNFSLTCSTDVVSGVAEVHTLTGTLGTTTFSLDGAYGISSGTMNVQLALTAPDLDELLAFTGTDSVSGSTSLSITIDGDLKKPQSTIKLKADSLTYGSILIGDVILAGELDNSGIAYITNLTLNNRNSELQLSAFAKVLENGVPIPADSLLFDCSLVVPQLLLEDFIDSISGKVALNSTIRGTINDPQGTIELSGADISAAGQTINNIALDATLGQQRIMIDPLRITIDSGQDVTINGWAAIKDSFDLSLSTSGINLQSIAALAAVDSLEGTISMALQTGGIYTKPEVHGRIGIDNIHVGTLSPDPIDLQVDMSNQQIELTGKAVGDIHASYNIDSKVFSTNLVFNNLSLKPYLALSGQNLDGTLSSAIMLSGKSDSLSTIQGTVDIQNLYITYDTIPIVETSDLKISIEKESYSIPEFSIALATEGLLKGYAKGLLNGPHDIVINGTIPLEIVRHFTADYPDLEGTIAIDAALQGTVDSPDLHSDIRLRNIGMSIPGLTGRLNSLNGRILANRESIRVETMQGNIDDGAFTVQGELKLDNLTPSDLLVNINLKAVPIGVPDMLDIVLDSKLRLSGNPDTTLLTGDIALLEGLYYQDIVINPLTGIGNRTRKEASPPAEITTPYLKTMKFDVGIQAQEPFQADNNMVQLTISPDLQLMGTLAAPALNGRAHVDEGSITYLKKVFTVEKGIIDFVNPYAIEPEIEIIGSVPVRDWTITIALSGTPDDLTFKLSSDDPSLEDDDLLSLLVLGKTRTELLGGIQSGGGQSSQQMLASLVSSTFGEDIKKATGLDILLVETGDNENENSDKISVTMGKQITRRLATTYTVETEESGVVQRATAEYRILQNLSIAGYQDTKSVFGGELRLTWEKR